MVPQSVTKRSTNADTLRTEDRSMPPLHLPPVTTAPGATQLPMVRQAGTSEVREAASKQPGARGFDRILGLACPKDAGELPISRTTSSALIAQRTRFLSTSWAQQIDFYERAFAKGHLQMLFVDLDNCMYQPRGYHGSESWEWSLTDQLAGPPGADGATEARKAARSKVLKRRDVAEPWMIEHGFFEPIGDLTADILERLQALRDRGLRIVAITARPAKMRDDVLRILEQVGIAGEPGRGARHLTLDEVLLTTGTGMNKVEAVRDALRRFDVPKHRALFADDLRKNTDAIASECATLLYQCPRPNHCEDVHEDYMARAAASSGGEQFLQLLNAHTLASCAQQRRAALDYGRAHLPPALFEALRQEVTALNRLAS